jgi:hypothetical protein
VFALKLKAFFCSLKGRFEEKMEYLVLAGQTSGNENPSYLDLDLVRHFFAKMEFQYLKNGSKGLPLYSEKEGRT